MRKVIAVFLAWMVLLAGAFFRFPSWGMVLWSVIGVSAATAGVIGIFRNSPRRKAPWILLSVAFVSFVTGDAVSSTQESFPSIGDAINVATFALLSLATWRLVRSGATGRDRAGLIDSLILTAGVGLLSWIYLISPYLQDPELTFIQKVVAAAYPLEDLLIFMLLVRLITAVRRSPAVILLVVAGAGLLVGDVVYGLTQLAGAYVPGGLVELPYIVFYAAAGLAALHPSMAALTEPRVLRRAEVTGRRLLLLGASSLIAPAVLLIEDRTGGVRNGGVIAAVATVLFALVVTRLYGAVQEHRLVVARERGLRAAGAALLSATDVDTVTAVVRGAVGGLLPPGTPHEVVVDYTPGESVARAAAGKAVGDGADVESESPIHMVYTRSLAAQTGARLGEHEVTLRCPLGGRRVTGALFVAADEIVLVTLQEAALVLASQAALALQSIAANVENAKRESEAYFRTLVLNAADVILILDDGNRVGYASPSATAMFGPRDLIGTALIDLVDTPHRPAARAVLDTVRAGRSQHGLADWTVRRGDELVQAEVSCRDLSHERTVAGVVITLRDVTERRRLEHELLRRAYYDSLTGLPNRALFADRAERAAARISATTTDAVAAVLLVGLDDFKRVNDTMGTDVGDRLLIEVGQRLVAAMHPDHTVARLGADEFAIMIDDIRGPGDAEDAADKVLAAFTLPFALDPGDVHIQASIGVATTADAADGAQLVSRADVALAMAKNTGKARWQRYEASLHTRILERLQLRAALNQAIANGELLLNYQPIVDLATARTRGFEALVRWQHPTDGLVPPMVFIPIAEESGLIVPLGAWVLRTAIEAAAQWRRLRPTDSPYVSVNVSARQFRTPGFIAQVRDELTRAGLPPHCLILEITESLLLGDHEQVGTDLETLRRLGVRVSIDDFGTGYSSLSYLHQVPIDIVKLDKSFVDTISTVDKQYDLVKGIVQLAHTLRLNVVAEGIETSVDRELLIHTGCEYGQGYLFARPMSHEDALEWLQASRTTAEPVGAAA